jgi:uncharacterized protein
MRGRLNWLDYTAMVLVLIGGINWGLVGFFNFNLVTAIFGATVGNVIFAIVGLAALYAIYTLSKMTPAQTAGKERREDRIRRAA